MWIQTYGFRDNNPSHNNYIHSALIFLFTDMMWAERAVTCGVLCQWLCQPTHNETLRSEWAVQWVQVWHSVGAHRCIQLKLSLIGWRWDTKISYMLCLFPVFFCAWHHSAMRSIEKNTVRIDERWCSFSLPSEAHHCSHPVQSGFYSSQAINLLTEMDGW